MKSKKVEKFNFYFMMEKSVLFFFIETEEICVKANNQFVNRSILYDFFDMFLWFEIKIIINGVSKAYLLVCTSVCVHVMYAHI